MRGVLARDLGARDVVVGYDFSFGRGRAGNVAGCASSAPRAGHRRGGRSRRSPSTASPARRRAIRELVSAGDVAAAAATARPAVRDRGCGGAGRRPGPGPRLSDRQRRPRGRAAAEARDLRRPRARSSTARWLAPVRRGGAQRRHATRRSLGPAPRRGDASRPTCWISTAISTTAACASRSASACATSNASSRSTRWSRRFGQTSPASGCYRPDHVRHRDDGRAVHQAGPDR